MKLQTAGGLYKLKGEKGEKGWGHVWQEKSAIPEWEEEKRAKGS